MFQGKESMSRHGDANTRQNLEIKLSLEDMKSTGATNNYHGKNLRSEVMQMPQEEEIMTGM